MAEKRSFKVSSVRIVEGEVRSAYLPFKAAMDLISWSPIHPEGRYALTLFTVSDTDFGERPFRALW